MHAMVVGVWGKEDLLDLAGQLGLTGGDDDEMSTNISASLPRRIKKQVLSKSAGSLITQHHLLALFTTCNLCFTEHVSSKEIDGEQKRNSIAQLTWQQLFVLFTSKEERI